MKKIILGSVILGFLLLISLITYFSVSSSSSTTGWYIVESNENIGVFEEQLIMTYQDGSTSTITPQWLYHEDKIIENITYSLYGIPDKDVTVNMQQFQVQYTVKNDNDNVVSQEILDTDQVFTGDLSERRLLVSKKSSPFDFVDYSVPDGEYMISFIPSGTIFVDGQETNLPCSVDVQIMVKDERAIDIGFN